MSAAFFGSFVERYGPRVSGLLSTACFTSGLLGTALAVYLGQVWLMYLSYGMIGGIGLGIGYITPVSTFIKWFPHNRGFAAGLAILGFGFAALIAVPAIQFLYEAYGLPLTLTILAILYCLVMLVSALYLKAPQEGDIQVQYALKSQDDIKRQNGKKSATVAKSYGLLTKQYTAYQALKTWQFYGLWWMLFINITCGIGLLSVASPMAQEVVDLPIFYFSC